MKILNKATIYKCKLPSAEILETHLDDCRFAPVLEIQFASAGFIEIDGKLVTEVAGGYAVTLRYDEKIMPKAALNALVDERVTAELAELDFDADDDAGPALDKHRIDEIKEEVYLETLKTALVKTTHIRAFYYEADNVFIVEETSKKLADIMTNKIVQAVGSVEFVTVYLSEVVGSLTGRLKNYVTDPHEAEHFGRFSMGGKVRLKNESDTITVNLDDIAMGNHAISEAIGHGMQVQQIELYHELVSFNMDSNFRLRGIAYTADPAMEDESDDSGDPIFRWRTEAGVRLLQLANIVRDLLEMFEYKQPELLEPELRNLTEISDGLGS